MNMFRKARKGFTLVEIMIVVAIIGILIAIAVPGFVKARTQSRMRACQENLTKIDGAKEQWALDNNKTTGETPAWSDLCAADGTGYIKADPGTGLVCPSQGTYQINAIGTVPACSLAADPDHHVLP